MAQAITRSADYRKNSRKQGCGTYPCVICGKPIVLDTARYTVHLHLRGDGCAQAVTEEEAAALDPSTGMDLERHPIGADCLRRHPELKPYV